MDDKFVHRGIQITSLQSWRGFHSFVFDDLVNKPAYVYRGQADVRWKIESSIDRYDKEHPTHPNFIGGIPQVFNGPPVLRETHLKAFRFAIQGRRRGNASMLSEDECWARGNTMVWRRHSLDWMLSPFVALYFAFENEFVRWQEFGRTGLSSGIRAFH